MFFQDDMESGQGLWSSDGWDLGEPMGDPDAAYSPVNCWGTNLTGPYGINEADWNLTHEIDLTSASDGVTMTVWMYYDMEYGYDLGRAAVDFTPGKPLPEAGTSVRVEADRGWQNSGLRLESGVSYRLRATGRYQVADQPQIPDKATWELWFPQQPWPGTNNNE